LSEDEKRALLESLKRRVGSDKKIKLDMKVDPELIGGLVVEWDDAYRMDLSVVTSIKRLEAEILSAV